MQLLTRDPLDLPQPLILAADSALGIFYHRKQRPNSTCGIIENKAQSAPAFQMGRCGIGTQQSKFLF